MGGPKALLLLDGAPLVAQHVARLSEAGCQSVLVVAPTSWAELVRASAPEAKVIGASTASQAESLAAGLQALDASASVVVVTPVDMAPVSEVTVRGLLGALTPERDAVTPRCGRVGGHPVIIRRAALEVYAGGGPYPSLHAHLESLGARRLRLEVDDLAVSRDLDTPEDLRSTPAFVVVEPEAGARQSTLA